DFYKCIDLKNKKWYQYKTFSDTAQITKSGVLADGMLPGPGWTFYISSVSMKNEPKVLADTMFAGVNYMRIKFSRLDSKVADNYVIGYLRCDNKGKLFSLEKKFSNKVNCTMTRYDEFKKNALKPFASTVIEFLSDTLSTDELIVFSAWEKNAKANPLSN
ncbi:MAG TPA: hypothetical protein VEV87_04870, partial [Chitinophagaceae bacterium]|nr:hypothetical protein [Chitinophagaceae bacterium]